MSRAASERIGEAVRGIAILGIARRGGEPVAEAAYGFDEADPELAAQPADEDLDGVRIALEALVVDVLGELGARDDLVLMVGEIFQHPEFLRGEPQQTVVA